MACDFERAKVEVIIVFDAAGEIGGLQMRPAQAAAPPYVAPDYAVASAYTEREVTVGAGEWALPGTLTMPAGAGPFPAVVLVHGSGPNDRDETFGPNKTFKDLALGLGSRGVAVLRYDKRTKVHGVKIAPLTQFTVKEETIDDALLAAALLRKEPGIDPKRIYVLGHSLGGMLAPRIAAADPSLAGIIVMAGAVRSLDQSIFDQMTYLANADGVVSEAEQNTLDGARKTIETVKALTPADAASGKGISGGPRLVLARSARLQPAGARRDAQDAHSGPAGRARLSGHRRGLRKVEDGAGEARPPPSSTCIPRSTTCSSPARARACRRSTRSPGMCRSMSSLTLRFGRRSSPESGVRGPEFR